MLAGCSSDESGTGSSQQSNDTTTTDTVGATVGGVTTQKEADTGRTGGAVRSAGCGRPSAPAVTDERRTLDSDGTERWYLLTTPESGVDQPLPLLLDFHGLSEGAEVHARMTSFDALAKERKFVVVYPNGTGALASWQVDAANNPDLAFVDRLLDTLEGELCIDTSRVYASGLSNGAMFSSTLACQRSDRIAAIAPVAGIQYQAGCQTDRPVPIIAFHGTKDPILLFNGGLGELGGLFSGAFSASDVVLPEPDLDGEGYPAAVREWATHNGCEPRPSDTRPVTGVMLRTYDCPFDGPVEFYVVEGGGHAWPGSEFSRSIEKIIGMTNMELHASELIWDFLSSHRLPTD